MHSVCGRTLPLSAARSDALRSRFACSARALPSGEPYRLLPKHTVYWHGDLGNFGMMRDALALTTLHVVFIQWKLHHLYL